MLAACSTIELPRRSVDLLRNEPQPLTAEFAAGTIRVRIGVHSGPAFAGVVGDKMPRYWHALSDRAQTCCAPAARLTHTPAARAVISEIR
jgi:class 3 adenylate cyclase